MHEAELIQNILKGNQQDYEVLIKKYQASVLRIAIGLVHNKEDAEEICQDVFIKLYQSLAGYQSKAAFSTWLYRITVNTSLNYSRKKKYRAFWTSLTELLQIPSTERSAETILSERSENNIIQQAISRLPEKQRLAFVFTQYEELPQKQVAEIMHISEGAVEQLLLRARSNLKKRLEKELDRP